MLPFVESYWVTLAFVKQLPAMEPQKFEVLEEKVQSLAENLHVQGFLTYYESCSLEFIGNAILRYAELGILKTKEETLTNLCSGEIQQEIVYYMGDESSDHEMSKEIFERLSFFKPPMSATGIINFEEDFKKIYLTQQNHSVKKNEMPKL